MYEQLPEWIKKTPRVIGVTTSNGKDIEGDPLVVEGVPQPEIHASERLFFFTKTDAGFLADRVEALLGRDVSEPSRMAGYNTSADPLHRFKPQVEVAGKDGGEPQVYELGQFRALLWKEGVNRPGKLEDDPGQVFPFKFTPEPLPATPPRPNPGNTSGADLSNPNGGPGIGMTELQRDALLVEAVQILKVLEAR